LTPYLERQAEERWSWLYVLHQKFNIVYLPFRTESGMNFLPNAQLKWDSVFFEQAAKVNRAFVVFKFHCQAAIPYVYKAFWDGQTKAGAINALGGKSGKGIE